MLNCTKFGSCQTIILEMIFDDEIILHAPVLAHGFSQLVFQEFPCGGQKADCETFPLIQRVFVLFTYDVSQPRWP